MSWNDWKVLGIAEGVARLAAIVSLAAALVACGDAPHGVDGDDAGEPLPDAAAAGDAAPDGTAASDASPDASLPLPTIDGVSLLESPLDGQIRQGGSATMILHGTGLDHASITFDDFTPQILPGASDTSLQVAILVPHGAAPGPRTLVLHATTSPLTRSIANAIEVTPIVVSPTGTPDGRGTPKSPLVLCRDWSTDALAGDLLQLDAGVHECDAAVKLARGVLVRGAGRTDTSVRGRGDVAFGGFVVANGGAGESLFEQLSIVGGSDPAIEGGQGALTVSDVQIETLGEAIVARGETHLTNVDVHRSLEGLTAIDAHVVVKNTHLSGNFGIGASRSVLELDHVDIDDLGANSSLSREGIALEGGHLVMKNDSSIIGNFRNGIRLNDADPATGAAAGFDADVSGTEIDVLDFGIFASSTHGSTVVVHASLLATTEAFAVNGEGFVRIDVSKSVLDGGSGLGIHDRRTTAGVDIDATHVKLNGHFLVGEIFGPQNSSGSGFRVDGPNTLHL